MDPSLKHLTVVERYYTPRYKIDIKKKSEEDQCILTHSNRVCVITLAPTHIVLKERKTIQRVDFKVGPHVDRLNNKVTGKGKKGGQQLTELAPLCRISCTDGTSYTLHSCIRGSLMEVNEKLVEKPHLLTEKPSTEGYIAIVLPKLAEFQDQMNRLLTREQYLSKCEK